MNKNIQPKFLETATRLLVATCLTTALGSAWAVTPAAPLPVGANSASPMLTGTVDSVASSAGTIRIMGVEYLYQPSGSDLRPRAGMTVSFSTVAEGNRMRILSMSEVAK